MKAIFERSSWIVIILMYLLAACSSGASKGVSPATTPTAPTPIPVEFMELLKVDAGVDDSESAFALSEDGSHLIYLSDVESAGQNQLYRFNISRRLRSRLNADLPPGSNVLDYRQIPNSDLIIYRSDEITRGRITLFAVRLDGTNRVQLSDATVSSQYVGVAGDRIIYKTSYSVTGGTTTELWSVKKDGTENLKISAGANTRITIISEQIISPQNKIIYQADETTRGVYDLFSVNADGSLHRKISGTVAIDGSIIKFAVKENSDVLVYATYVAAQDRRDLFRVNIDGSQLIKLDIQNISPFSFDLTPAAIVFTDFFENIYAIGYDDTEFRRLNDSNSRVNWVSVRFSQLQSHVIYQARIDLDNNWQFHSVNLSTNQVSVISENFSSSIVTSSEYFSDEAVIYSIYNTQSLRASTYSSKLDGSQRRQILFADSESPGLSNYRVGGIDDAFQSVLIQGSDKLFIADLSQTSNLGNYLIKESATEDFQNVNLSSDGRFVFYNLINTALNEVSKISLHDRQRNSDQELSYEKTSDATNQFVKISAPNGLAAFLTGGPDRFDLILIKNLGH